MNAKSGQLLLLPVRQTSTFDVDRGAASRDAAIEAVDAGASTAWKESCLSAIRKVATLRHEFTTDAVWYILDRSLTPPPREPRAMGAMMRKAVKLGWCTKIQGRTKKSERAECHRRDLSVYTSRVCQLPPEKLR